MGIPNEKRATRHLRDFTLYHLAGLKADPAAPHLIEATEKALGAVLAALDKREAAETVELNHQAVATRKDFDLDEATRLTELAALAAVAKDRGSSAYRAAFPHGLSWLVGLRGKAQENANHELVAVLRQRLPELGEKFGTQLEQLAKSATAAEDAWRAAERAAKTALVEEQIARSELVRQLHSNRGALRALYPRNPRRVASYFPPSYSRVAGEPDAVDTDEAQAEASAG